MNSLPRWFGRKREKQQQKQQHPQQLKAKQRPQNLKPIYAFDEQSYRRWCHSLLHFFQIDTLLCCLFEHSDFDYCIFGILILILSAVLRNQMLIEMLIHHLQFILEFPTTMYVHTVQLYGTGIGAKQR